MVHTQFPVRPKRLRMSATTSGPTGNTETESAQTRHRDGENAQQHAQRHAHAQRHVTELGSALNGIAKMRPHRTPILALAINPTRSPYSRIRSGRGRRSASPRRTMHNGVLGHARDL